MSNQVKQALVIGGGFSGMAAAIELRKRGIAVDLVELDSGWRSYGAGISLGGGTLRCFRQLGVLDAFLERGSAADGANVFTAQGHPIATIPTPRIAGPDVPGSGGIMRPVLAAILAEATRASGATVRLGETFSAINQDGDGAEVQFKSGGPQRYDLVIGADGLYSAVRKAMFAGAPEPRFTGQNVWRAVLPRPQGLDAATMWIGPKVKAGINAVSKTEAYLFVTEDSPNKARVAESDLYAALTSLLKPFTAPMMLEIRAALTPASQIVLRPLEAVLLPQPWHRGRVVLIGDAAHATTPHLASGACLGLEDAIVLADEIGKASTVAAGLEAFNARRWERCRMVVENSLRLGEIEMTNGDKAEHAKIMRESLIALAAPA